MDWNKIAEYLRESGFFTQKAKYIVCDSVLAEEEDNNFWISIYSTPNDSVVIYMCQRFQGKKFSVCDYYDESQDTYNFIHYLREHLEDMNIALDRKIAKEFPNIF